ncbi:RNA polymerase sigma factor [Sphingobacterium psychroaquaticum]|uniref:RNA polymerase sigma factor n=1 Tax=Sphingobacterium psychroaquaticum TaxID=561061 RepID=UPI00106B3C6F|nr:RNA polymerase sigma factor [Sphingobacterium psychroaquaticum]QBQ40704.1 RNA polymerase sigma factor [Sphingobacterium psychroaquaticum]
MNSSIEQTFLALIKQHKGILHKVSRMYADNPEDREDLQQEIMIQLWKSYAYFKGESAFSSWMYRVAVNTSLTYFKKEKKRSNTFTDNENVNEPAQEDYNDTQDTQLQLFYKAIQEISPIEKALMLYFMEGLSHREIGEQLGISEGNARVKLNRTKEKLQEIIKKYKHEF